jgi:hypothetical protein
VPVGTSRASIRCLPSVSSRRTDGGIISGIGGSAISGRPPDPTGSDHTHRRPAAPRPADSGSDARKLNARGLSWVV